MIILLYLFFVVEIIAALCLPLIWVKGSMKLKWVWYDLWVGFFWDKGKHWLYFIPFPTIVIIFKYK